MPPLGPPPAGPSCLPGLPKWSQIFCPSETASIAETERIWVVTYLVSMVDASAEQPQALKLFHNHSCIRPWHYHGEKTNLYLLVVLSQTSFLQLKLSTKGKRSDTILDIQENMTTLMKAIPKVALFTKLPVLVQTISKVS